MISGILRWGKRPLASTALAEIKAAPFFKTSLSDLAPTHASDFFHNLTKKKARILLQEESLFKTASERFSHLVQKASVDAKNGFKSLTEVLQKPLDVELGLEAALVNIRKAKLKFLRPNETNPKVGFEHTLQWLAGTNRPMATAAHLSTAMAKAGPEYASITKEFGDLIKHIGSLTPKQAEEILKDKTLLGSMAWNFQHVASKMPPHAETITNELVSHPYWKQKIYNITQHCNNSVDELKAGIAQLLKMIKKNYNPFAGNHISEPQKHLRMLELLAAPHKMYERLNKIGVQSAQYSAAAALAGTLGYAGYMGSMANVSFLPVMIAAPIGGVIGGITAAVLFARKLVKAIRPH